jgi:hypothetical protein
MYKMIIGTDLNEGVSDKSSPHRTLDFGVAEQELYRPQVARPAID